MLKLFILGNKVKIILYCVIRDPLYDDQNIEPEMSTKLKFNYVSNIS